MELQITLRTATIEDLETLLHWDQQPHVIASDPDDDWNWAIELRRFPDWREQFIAELDGRPIGCIQIIDPAKEETHYWGEVPENLRAIDIWVGKAEDLNKGYGTQMMHLAIDRCFSEAQVQAILIDPLVTNVNAIRFYERIGFKFLAYRKFEDSECAIYEFTRKKLDPLAHA